MSVSTVWERSPLVIDWCVCLLCVLSIAYTTGGVSGRDRRSAASCGLLVCDITSVLPCLHQSDLPWPPSGSVAIKFCGICMLGWVVGWSWVWVCVDTNYEILFAADMNVDWFDLFVNKLLLRKLSAYCY